MLETKIPKLSSEMLTDTARLIGPAVLSAVLMLTMFEASDDAKRVILPNQSAPVFAGENEDANNPVRREREETAPHFISYSEVQRTAARSGRS